MGKQTLKNKRKEWLRRYIPAEILGTVLALIAAWSVYATTHSYVAATAAGWLGEGVGFYGYFIITELHHHSKRYRQHPLLKRSLKAFTGANTNLLVEFMPAELLDNFIIRPFAMFTAPHFIHPYPVGFLVGKFSADIIFYALAIVGYELRKYWFPSNHISE